jgi:hypothetical protein
VLFCRCRVVKFVEAKPEPFADPANPWLKAKKQSGGCMIL